ncbi:2-oxoacid:acceptor oxidoreductase subunit alpha [Candidatus Micrarchaeota archaeon]|nr:2-oxoacid:acceptor oxidoreductase subunit alpha [Candidatus Micrarchaeota archaeon]
MKLIQGNEAISEGALAAGMKFYSGYPITPASEIMHYLAKAKQIQFINSEDEIAAINMAIGASLAGVKAMTATSGPGMSLMQEGIGYAHMAEVPLVVVNVQRVGPGTGMPTMPAQGDVMQVKYGSHGDYFPICFYPSTVSECYKYTIEAFNAAEESLSPVILLCDGYVGHLYETVKLSETKFELKTRAKKKLGEGLGHTTSLLNKNGVPNTKDPSLYEEYLERAKKKMHDAAEKYKFYEYTKNENTRDLIIAYGICARVASAFTDKYSLFKPVRMFPILSEEIEKAAKEHDRIIVIEMNAGQYSRMIQSVAKKTVHTISVLGGTIKPSKVKQALDALKQQPRS